MKEESSGLVSAPTSKQLGGTAARGAIVTMGGQVIKTLLQFGGIIILARLLSPTDYGLLAMVVAIIGVGEVFRDFGLSSAAIQATSVSVQQRTNLFWINSAIGLALTGVVFTAAPLIALFFDQPLLSAIAKVLSVTFLLNGLATQYRAQLVREMRFRALALVEVTSQAVGLFIGVMMAISGYGYWGLVGQQVGQVAATMVFMIAAGRWCPGVPRRGAEMGAFLRFGWNLMNTQLISYLARNVDTLVIGNRFGAEVLGFYNRAYQLLMMPLNQINAPSTTVALPILMRLRNEPERYDAFLIRGQETLLHVIVGMFAFGCAQAEPLIMLVLGPQWAPAIPIFQILAFGGVFQAAGYACYWVFISKGLSASLFRFTLVSRVAFVCAILYGIQWGVMGVATAHSVVLALSWLAVIAWLRNSGAPIRRMLGNGLLVIGGYGICGIASFLASVALATSMYGRLLVGGGTMMLAFLLVCLVWPAFRSSVMTIIGSRTLLRRQ